MARGGVSLVAIISMVLVSSVVMATDYIVCDDRGGTADSNYTEWAKDKVFRVGDNLVFNYNSSKHNVFKVNGTLFKDCIIPEASQALQTGKDMIPLATPGRKWYICGVSNHCSTLGMKLVINVVSDGPAPAPSAAHSLLSSFYVLLIAPIIAIAPIALL